MTESKSLHLFILKKKQHHLSQLTDVNGHSFLFENYKTRFFSNFCCGVLKIMTIITTKLFTIYTLTFFNLVFCSTITFTFIIFIKIWVYTFLESFISDSFLYALRCINLMILNDHGTLNTKVFNLLRFISYLSSETSYRWHSG